MRWTLVALGVNVTLISGPDVDAPQAPSRIVVARTRMPGIIEVREKRGIRDPLGLIDSAR
jgi:hypothetical protein